ncbi:hypothetical protein KCV03_g287, partial [Aureobasidium melanogenum]
MVAEDSKTSAVAVLEIGDAEGDFEDGTEDDVDIDKLVMFPLVDLNVDIVLDVDERVVLFRFAVLESVDLGADSLAETVLNNVEVDMSVVNVVNWLFEGDLGEKVKFRQAERQYKRWVTTFVQQKPYSPRRTGSQTQSVVNQNLFSNESTAEQSGLECRHMRECVCRREEPAPREERRRCRARHVALRRLARWGSRCSKQSKHVPTKHCTRS